MRTSFCQPMRAAARLRIFLLGGADNGQLQMLKLTQTTNNLYLLYGLKILFLFFIL